MLIPLVIYVAMFCADWKLALMSLASIPISLLSMVIMYSVGMKRIPMLLKMSNSFSQCLFKGHQNVLSHCT